MEVSNFRRGQQVEVRLSYSELLVATAGVYELVNPTVVGPRYSTIPAAGASRADAWIETPYTPAGTPPVYSLALAGVVDAGMPIRDLSSPSHTLLTKWQNPARAEFALAPSERAGGNRDFV